MKVIEVKYKNPVIVNGEEVEFVRINESDFDPSFHKKIKDDQIKNEDTGENEDSRESNPEEFTIKKNRKKKV